MRKIFNFITATVRFVLSFIFGLVGCGFAILLCLVLAFLLLPTYPLLTVVVILVIPFIAIANWESFKKALNLKITVNKQGDDQKWKQQKENDHRNICIVIFVFIIMYSLLLGGYVIGEEVGYRKGFSRASENSRCSKCYNTKETKKKGL